METGSYVTNHVTVCRPQLGQPNHQFGILLTNTYDCLLFSLGAYYRLDTGNAVQNMFKIYACAVCQEGIKPEEAISLHFCPSQRRKIVSPWDGPFLCHSCQQKKEAMEGKSSQGTEIFAIIDLFVIFRLSKLKLFIKICKPICHLSSLSCAESYNKVYNFQNCLRRGKEGSRGFFSAFCCFSLWSSCCLGFVLGQAWLSLLFLYGYFQIYLSLNISSMRMKLSFIGWKFYLVVWGFQYQIKETCCVFI